MPRRKPEQDADSAAWMERRALIAMAGEIARTAGGHWLLTSDEVGAVIGRSKDVVEHLRKATKPIPAGPPMTGWVKDGTAFKLHTLRLAEWLTSLEEVA
jgi:hypothetical protein